MTKRPLKTSPRVAAGDASGAAGDASGTAGDASGTASDASGAAGDASEAGVIDEPQAKKRRTNPKRAQRLAENKYLDKSTIKCTIGPFCRFKVIRDEIEETVYWMSKLYYHAHHVMTLYLLGTGGVLPSTPNLYGHWNSLMRTLANHLSDKKTRGLFVDACEEYVTETGLRKDWPENVTSGWRGKVLDQMAMSASTTHKNHMNINYLIYLKRYIGILCTRYTEIKGLEEREPKKFQKVFGLILSTLDIHRNKTVEEIIDLRPKTKEAIPPDHPVWVPVKALVKYLRDGYGAESILDSEDPIKKMPLLFQILKPLEEHGQRLQQQWREGTLAKKKKQKWVFAICPQAKYRPQHIRMSSSALKMLFLGMTKHYSHLKNLYEACCRDSVGLAEWESNSKFWEALFNIKRVGRRTKGRFGNSIETDGVSVSCTWDLRKSEDQCKLIDLKAQQRDLKEKLKKMGDSPCIGTATKKAEMDKHIKELEKTVDSSLSCSIEKAIEMSEKDKLTVEWNEEKQVYICDHKVVACDPGFRNTVDFVTYSPDAMMHHNNWKISDGGYHTEKDQRFKSGCVYGNWWRYISGQKRFTKKMNKRMKEFCPDMLNIPSNKTSKKEKLLESYKYQVKFLPDMEEAFFSEDKWFQKTKMRKYVKTQQALEKCVRAITGENDKAKQKDIVVAFGDKSNAGCMRGLAPLLGNALVRKLRKDTIFFFVDEFRTSKKCSSCHTVMSDLESTFRIKTCDNKDCIRTFWDRDVNASINILKNFFYQIVHKKRHRDFNKTEKTNQTNEESTG